MPILYLLLAALFHMASPAHAQLLAVIPAPMTPGLETTVAARTINVIRPRIESWPETVEVRGNIMPWQESRIGTEVGGLRLVSVLVNVGDIVKKGQVLARLDPATVEVDLETANAQVAEAKATAAQATATLERASRLVQSGGVSRQEITAYETQKQTAEARLNAARALVKMQQLRMRFTTLQAPDDGVISARSASEGAIVQAGSELFRLIRQGRLEWRAEMDGETLLKISPGQSVVVNSPLGRSVRGRVRQISPTIDLSTRKGIIYVDIPIDSGFKAGLSVTGTLSAGKHKVLLLPLSALLRQEGTFWVFSVGEEKKVTTIEVQTGRTKGDWMEIVSGITGRSRVLAKAADFAKSGGAAKLQEVHPEKIDEDALDEDD